jgi:hypothetical protein
MNLVQINERLKEMPVQALQQYANGSNPEVPPYLALGEIQRREKLKQQMATGQGAAQGQPSIKEQIEQKAGLLALQQAKVQQQQPQPQPGGPVPIGTPGPEMQGQQQEMAMASGGVARLPVRSNMYKFANGGIIAFQEGGSSLNERAGQQMMDKGSIYDKNFGKSKEERDLLQKEEMLGTVQERLAKLEANKEQLVGQFGQKMYDQALDKARREITSIESPPMPKVAEPATAVTPPTPIPDNFRRAPFQDPRIGSGTGIASGMSAQSGAAGSMTPENPMAPTAGAPQANPALAGLPGVMPGQSKYFAQADTDLAKPIAAPTPEGIIAQQKALSPESMQEDFMKKRSQEQRDRISGERESFEKSKPTGLQDLIRVLGQSSQYKGLSGLAPAYTANQQQKRAEELSMESRMNKMQTEADAREYEGGKELFGARSKSMDQANAAYQNKLATKTKTLADLAGVDQRRMDEAANRLSNIELEKLRITARAAEAAKPGEAERIEAKFMALKAEGKDKEAEEYLARMASIKGQTRPDRNPTPDERLRAAKAVIENYESTDDQKKVAREQIASIMLGQEGGPSKMLSKADISATAKASGKTEQQVIEAAKARGYTIQ